LCEEQASLPWKNALSREVGRLAGRDELRDLSIKKQGVTVNDAKRPMTVLASSWYGAPQGKRIEATCEQGASNRLTNCFALTAFFVADLSHLNHKERKERKDGLC
jgi:hypothetical protein